MLLRLIIVLSITAFTPLNAEAASLTIVPSGTGSYTVTGNGMDGVAGIDLQLQYDPAILSSPAVTPGGLISGAMMAANTNIKGSIRIGILSEKSFPGSGTVASISFASRKAAGGIISVSASAIDTTGTPVATQTSLAGESSSPAGNGQPTTPGIPASVNANPVATPPAATVATQDLSATVSPASTTTGTSILGTVIMPAEVPEETAAASDEPIPLPLPVPPSEPSTPQEPEPPVQEQQHPEPEPEPEPEKTSPPASMTHQGVMDHFRTFSGEKTPDSCSALFTREISLTISQKPPIAISDGTTPVIIVATLNSQKVSPNFALSNAKLVSISKSGDSWIIKTLPQAQAIQASLTILSGKNLVEFPLTLVPPAGNLPLTKADFAAFLKDSGVTPPKRDLNNDGIHDYRDDYIYTAHYLIGTSAAVERKGK